jgi:hypothetical protein
MGSVPQKVLCVSLSLRSHGKTGRKRTQPVSKESQNTNYAARNATMFPSLFVNLTNE